MLKNVKDYLIRKVALSFLLKWADGKKTELMRAIQGVNILLTALYYLVPLLDQLTGTQFTASLDWLNGEWLAGLNAAAAAGLEFAIQDRKIKEKLQQDIVLPPQ